jgi:hypothetical protein
MRLSTAPAHLGVVLTLASLHLYRPAGAQESAFARVLLEPAAKLGLQAGYQPEGGIQVLSLTAADRRPGSNLMVKHLRPRFRPHKCYAVVGVPPPGSQLFLYAAVMTGKIVSQGNNEGHPKRIASVGFCVAREATVQLLVMTNTPGRVAYRVLSKPNHMQAEQERDLRAIADECLALCEQKKDECRGRCSSGSCSYCYTDKVRCDRDCRQGRGSVPWKKR